MHSSTSNSDAPYPPTTGGLPLVWNLARYAAPTIFVAAVLLAGFEAWGRASPSAPADTIEAAIVEEQMARARAGLAARVLVLGDSSALMGVDAGQLGESLGAPVESLATIGFVGPAGFAHTLSLHRASGKQPETLVLLFNAATLAVEEKVYSEYQLEQRVLTGKPPTSRVRSRQKIYDAVLRPVWGPPLPGSFGRHYGWAEDMRAVLRASHGSLIDPNVFAADKPSDLAAYKISAAFARRLPALRAQLDSARIAVVRLGLTPLPANHDSPASREARGAALERLRNELGLPAHAVLSLPATLDNDLFATATHLNARGRAAFTALLRKEIATTAAGTGK